MKIVKQEYPIHSKKALNHGKVNKFAIFSLVLAVILLRPLPHRISRRSIKLAELAHQRESQVYLELVAEKQAPKSPEDSNYRRSNSAGPRNRSVSPSGRESLGDAHSVASAVTNGSVFERLSARGLVGREKQMRAVSAQRELTFRVTLSLILH